MMSEVFYGKIKPDRLAAWATNKEPYDILEEKTEIRVGGWKFLDVADNLFREKTQVDWGCFAYKATKNELRALEEELKYHIDGIDDLQENVDYGVIFVELS